MNKYINSLLRYFCFYLISSAFLLFISEPMFEILRTIFPLAFPSYNPITEKEAYLALKESANLISAIITVTLATIVAVAFDNMRYEVVISKTDGFYRIGGCLSLYTSEFLVPDLISSLAVPMPFIILSCFSFPERAADIISHINATTLAFTDKLGVFWGGMLILAISLLARLPAAISGLKRWRGIWLADIGN